MPLNYHWRALAHELGQVELFESGMRRLEMLDVEWYEDTKASILFGEKYGLSLKLQVHDPFYERIALVHIDYVDFEDDIDAFVLSVRCGYIGLIESLRSAAMGCSKAD
jgi:hypothetical protein